MAGASRRPGLVGVARRAALFLGPRAEPFRRQAPFPLGGARPGGPSGRRGNPGLANELHQSLAGIFPVALAGAIAMRTEGDHPILTPAPPGQLP